jgi:hypothetical protein
MMLRFQIPFGLLFASPILQAALVTYLPLDSATGLTAGTPASGTNNAAITSAGAKFGSAALLDGDGDFFFVDAGSGVTGTAGRTISLWVNQDVGSADLRSPLSFGINGNGTKFDIDIDNAADGIEIGVGGGRSTTSGVGFTSGTWQFLTFSVAANSVVGNVLAYLNGGPAIASAANARAIATNGSRMQVGTSANTATGTTDPNIQFFDGLVDDIAVWNEVLTANEITSLYDLGESSLAYTADLFNQLKTVHDAGSGSTTIGALEWSYATGLGSTAGLSGSGSSFTLILDATSGTGLVAVPEPLVVTLLPGIGLLALRRRRRV